MSMKRGLDAILSSSTTRCPFCLSTAWDDVQQQCLHCFATAMPRPTTHVTLSVTYLPPRVQRDMWHSTDWRLIEGRP